MGDVTVIVVAVVLGVLVLETIIHRYKPQWGAPFAFIPFGADREIHVPMVTESNPTTGYRESAVAHRLPDLKLAIDLDVYQSATVRLLEGGQSAVLVAVWPHSKFSRCWGIARFDLQTSPNGSARIVSKLAPIPITQILFIPLFLTVLGHGHADIYLVIALGGSLYYLGRSWFTTRDLASQWADRLKDTLEASLRDGVSNTGLDLRD